MVPEMYMYKNVHVSVLKQKSGKARSAPFSQIQSHIGIHVMMLCTPTEVIQGWRKHSDQAGLSLTTFSSTVLLLKISPSNYSAPFTK